MKETMIKLDKTDIREVNVLLAYLIPRGFKIENTKISVNDLGEKLLTLYATTDDGKFCELILGNNTQLKKEVNNEH